MNFEELLKISVNEHTENKNGLTYLSWTWAWSEFKKKCPNASYEIVKFNNNLPYVYDENTGYMVFTKVSDGEKTYEMWLPVMDGNNKAMLNHEYTYKVKEYVNGQFTGQYKEKNVEIASMFDINKTIMRCLVKNIAMFGLGLYIYSGEDMPEGYEITKEEASKIVLTFGKYNGKTLGEVLEENEGYLQWLVGREDTKQSLKDACVVLINMPSEEDQNEKLKLMVEFENLVKDNEKGRKAIYTYYKVDSDKDMSLEQLKEAINGIKGKRGE